MFDAVARLNAALEGRYAIERELGEGGMATVYLADDLKHNRKVALKVLRPELAAVVGAERFLAEIETTANLTHPHILPLFDSGEADSFLFYVMPYLEGETLQDRIKREKQLPVDEAVRIATAVANALDYAHRHKVIHRDIKPANILIQDGEPVVSDFGIALALGAGGSDRLTETGLSLGTPYYMSPEQATGDQPVGSSTDTYALGSVLYEMLVGEPPYPGTTAQAVLGKIIAGKPVSATEHRPSVPGNVDAAVRKALEKLPADRFGSAQEFAKALADPGFRYGELAGVGSMHSGGVWNRLSIATTALAIAVTAVTVWALRGSEAGEPPAPSRVTLTLTPPQGVEINANWGLVISPDERTIVFSAGQGRRLFRRDLGQPEAVPISGTESAWKPFFSPDGASIGFFDDTRNLLKRIRLDGSGLQTLGPVPATGRSGVWREDSTIVFNSRGLGGLSQIAETGGDPRPVARDAGTIAWLGPLPGSEAVLGQKEVSGEEQVVVVDLETGQLKVLFPGRTARYVNTGHLVYWRGGGLWAVPFDLQRLEASGPETLIAQGVRASGNDYAHYDITENLLVYRPPNLTSGGQLPVWVDRQGNREPLDMELGNYAWPRISPDGQKVALVRTRQGNSDIWVVDLESGMRTQLTFNSALDWGPVWTPDGDRVVFRSERDGPMNLYWRRADGADEVQQLTSSPAEQRAYGWTPDGALLFTQEGDIWSLPMEPGAEPVLLMGEAYAESEPALSPDGGFISLQSEELGYAEIFVRPFPDLTGKWLVSTLDIAPVSEIPNADLRDGRSALWSRDGEEIYYLSERAFVRVPVSTEGAFTYGTPEVLFEGRWRGPTGGPHYDVSLDGERFLMIESVPSAQPSRNELIVVQNWRDVLRSQVPN